MQEWFTLKELEEFGLAGLPSSRRGIFKRAVAAGWKSRPRDGRGGGLEYHVGNLPELAQVALVEKLVGAVVKTECRQSPVVDEENPHNRRNARVAILQALHLYRVELALSERAAVAAFVTLYVAGSPPNVPTWVLSVFKTVSERSLWNWKSARKEERFGDLAKTQNNRTGSSILARSETGQVARYIGALVIEQPHLTSKHIRELCRAQFGDAITVKHEKSAVAFTTGWPDVRTFRRFISQWREQNADMIEKITNPDSFKNKRQLALGDAAAGINGLNEQWQIDASPVDALCVDGRYSLYAVIDVWSRRVMFSVAKTARTEASLLLIRRAILEWGVPAAIKTDNGADFVSKRFIGALRDLGIQQPLCRPFTPEGKPFVERVIGTVQRDLMPLLPGYIGHSVKDRKRIEARKAFSKRLGTDDARMFEIQLDHIQLQDRLDRWADDSYAHSAHAGLRGQTPFIKASSWIKPILKIESERAIDVLLAPLAGQDGFRTVGKKGLRIDSGNFWGAGLELYVGRRVFVRHDAEDMGRVYVFAEDGPFIGEAINYERQGISMAEATRMAKSRQKDFVAEQTREIQKERRKITPSKIAEDYLNMAKKDRGTVASFPKQSGLYETPQLAEARRAVTPHVATSSAEDQARYETFKTRFQAVEIPTASLSDEERWVNRYITLQTRVDGGEVVSDMDLHWMATNKNSHWLKAYETLEKMRVTRA